MLLRRLACTALLGLSASAGLVCGCNDNQYGPEKRHPNRPPETVLASGPPDSTYGTNYRVHFYYSGSDGDGTIDHFDFVLVDHPAIDDSIATADSTAPNRVVVRIPAPDDPRWTPTTARDTVLVTRADRLRGDPAPPRDSDQSELERHNEFVRRQSFERWHTFFVRSVDNEGLADATPDYRSFNSHTLAPTVSLAPPVDARRPEFNGPPTIIFNWDGSDPVGDGTIQEPIASRWVLLPSNKNSLGKYAGLPDSLFRLPPSAWSPWRAWGARDGSGRRAIVRDLQPVTGERGVGFYIFAVQAMDDGGAVTPVFDSTTPGKNNATAVFVSGAVGPSLTLRDRFLGTFQFTGSSRPVRLDIAAGQTIRICWSGDASSYGGQIVGYRFGWDLRNPSDDSEWEQNWSQTATCAPARVFSSGTHVFFLETRDNAESVTRARLEMTVQRVTRQRDLLFVDDSTHPRGDTDPGEVLEDERWLAVVDSLRAVRPFTFDPSRDWYDVREHNRLPPPMSLVFDYKTVVWTVVSSSAGSALRDVALFVDPFVEGQNSARGFNYLNLYLDNGGEMWVSGQQLSFVVWPLVGEQRPLDQLVPANLTNWNLDLHPTEDSVGVNSFFYRMGVEATDLGSGGYVPAPRFDRIAQGCIGFRRAGGDGGGAQTYRSSRVLAHAHRVAIPGTDVERPPAAGATYPTDLQVEHSHTLFLTATELQSLGAGGRVVAPTDTISVPEPHAHVFELADGVGRWGAPAFLEPDATWPSPLENVNPYRSRVNVEIYNMPTYLSRQTPQLAPPPERVLALYEFVSPTRADAEQGMLYPLTADQQPAILISKAATTDAYYSRAVCGFEPWRLSFRSHLQLASFVLLRHMQLGLPDAR